MATDQSQVPIGGAPTSFRMTRAEYQMLESRLSPPVVTDSTSEISAGFKLGVQHVLSLFRQKYVEGL